MTDAKLPTISIKGKQYVQVKDRIIYFNETFPNGFIETHIISELSSENIVVKAIVVPDVTTPSRAFVAHSQATVGEGMVNTTAALENAETSAVGRALGFMGIGVIESVASADEMNKALYTPKGKVAKTISNEGERHSYEKGSDNQDRCPHCGSTNQFHAKTCPNFKEPKGEIL